MANIEKQLTTADVFNGIIKTIKENGKMPDILDYALPCSQEFLIYDSDLSLEMNLDYGCEGIYLDLFVKGYFNELNEDISRVRLGTIKTLDDSDEAMREMSLLLAEFILELRNFRRENYELLEWKGIRVQYYKDEECNQKMYGVTYGNADYARSQMEKVEFSVARWKNLKTREEKLIRKQDLAPTARQ